MTDAGQGRGRFRGERGFRVAFASIWLVFLLWPAAGIAASGRPAWAIALGLAATAAFAAVYLADIACGSGRVSRMTRDLALTAVLLGLVGLTVPALGVTGPELVSYLPFIAALWLFGHPLRTGLTATGLIIAATAAHYIGSQATPNPRALLPLVSFAVILVAIRLLEMHEERERELVAQLAAMAEREELARVVHDALGHSLTAITVQAQLARRLVDHDRRAAAEQIDGVLVTARTALDEVRSTVTMLHGPSLADQLASSRAMLGRAGIRVTGDTAPPPDIAPRTAQLFSMCLREATTNVVRHSGAGTCDISITAQSLRVRDDGRGLPGDLADAPGHGLRGLRERAGRVGAALDIRIAEPGTDRPGTILEVTA